MNTQTLKAQTERQSNFELLRILSMFLIVLSHYLAHGAEFSYGDASIQNFFRVMFGGGGVGVVCFILISAYFLTGEEKIKPQKAVFIWFCMFAFSFSIGLYQYFSDPAYGKDNLVGSALPITSERWWFASTYLIMYLFVPYINVFLNNVERKKLEVLLIIMFVLWGLLPMVTDKSYGESQLLLFVCLYILVAYVKRYPLQNEKDTGVFLLLFGFVLSVIQILYLWHLGEKNDDYWYRANSITMWQELPQMMQGAGLFLIFKNIRVKQNAVCNVIAAVTFQIYLFSDHPFIRDLLWKKYFDNSEYHSSPMFFLHAFLSVLIVFAASAVVGWVYKLLIEGPVMFLSFKCMRKIKESSDT